MPEIYQTQIKDLEMPDPRWIDLYRIGFIACVSFPVLIITFIVAYFIWPYTPGLISVADIFDTLQENRLQGLITLDLAVPVMLPILVLQMLALYVALKHVNESYALIALVLGLLGIVLWLTVRPIAEMATLSNYYANAPTESAKSQYLAAGEALSPSLFITVLLGEFAVTFVLGLFYEGYSHLDMVMSELGSSRSPVAFWMSLYWVIYGLAFVLFGYSFSQKYPQRQASRSATRRQACSWRRQSG